MEDNDIIFLISQPRAGSTLLQNLLAQHAAIHTTSEPWVMLHPFFALREDGYTADYNQVLAHTALFDFCSTLDGGLKNYDEAIREMAYHLYGTACDQAHKTKFLDKTPRYYHILDDLLRVFPGAKFIILFRNPLAVLNSILNTHIKGHWVLLSRYKHDLLTAPPTLTSASAISSTQVYKIQYESLVADPQTHLSNLTDFLEIEFNTQMLSYNPGSAASGHMGDATGIQKYNQPSQERLDIWREMGRHEQTRHFALAYLDALGSEILVQMGYDPDDIRGQISRTPCKGGKVEVTWQELFSPDQAFQKRLYLIELALLEHRRLVHTWQKFRDRFTTR